MILAVKTAGPGNGEWTCYVTGTPFHGRLILGTQPSDVPLEAAQPAKAVLEAQGDEPPLIEPLEGAVKVNGRRIRKPRPLASGMTLGIGNRTFAVEEEGGILLTESTKGKAAKADEEGIGLDVFGVPAPFTLCEHPEPQLAQTLHSLHLQGAGLVQLQPGDQVREEFWAGEKCPAPLGPQIQALRKGLMVLEYREGRSIALAAYDWPEGEETVLVGWANRPLSIGYLANLYRQCPRMAGSILLGRRVREISESAASEWMSALGVLTAGVSRVYQNALVSVSGYSQLSRNGPEYVEKLAQSITSALERNEKTNRVLTNLSPWADVEKRTLRPSEIASAMKMLLAPAFRRQGTELKVETKDRGGVRAAPAEMYRLVFLLFYHLLRQTPAGGSAVLRVEEKSGGVLISAVPGTEEASSSGTEAEDAGDIKPREGFHLYPLLLERVASYMGGRVTKVHHAGAETIEVRLPAAPE